MNVELTPGESKFVEDLIADGEVRDADEAVAEALLRWKRERELKAAVDEGLRDLEEGRRVDSREMFDEKHRQLEDRIARERR